jgi:hypothetical protein
LLLEHAEGLTRKAVLKKCHETDLVRWYKSSCFALVQEYLLTTNNTQVRCGLRAALFSVHALLHRQQVCATRTPSGCT